MYKPAYYFSWFYQSYHTITAQSKESTLLINLIFRIKYKCTFRVTQCFFSYTWQFGLCRSPWCCLRIFGKRCSNIIIKPRAIKPEFSTCPIYPSVGGKLLWHWGGPTQSCQFWGRKKKWHLTKHNPQCWYLGYLTICYWPWFSLRNSRGSQHFSNRTECRVDSTWLDETSFGQCSSWVEFHAGLRLNSRGLSYWHWLLYSLSSSKEFGSTSLQERPSALIQIRFSYEWQKIQ